MLEVSSDAARQYIDAVATFEALEEARHDAVSTEGGMYWHAGPPTSPERKYLVRTSRTGAETSLGTRSEKTEQIYESFMSRRRENEERVKSLEAELDKHRKLNRALGVGRAEPLVVELLNRLAATGLMEHFRVVGTHALYAYEMAAGVRLHGGVLTTRDIDLLWDTQKRVQFATQLAKVDTSMLGVIKKVDPTFRLKRNQRYTAVNSKGFEVDVIRRMKTDTDEHPLKMSTADEDFFAVQAPYANLLLYSEGFSQVIVATDGTMARMNTIHPAMFVKFKLWMSGRPDRDPRKARRDRLQADAVRELLDKYLPHLRTTHDAGPGDVAEA